MRILGFDTASASTSVALLDLDAGLELEARDDPPAGERPRHATRLLALIVELLDRAGGGWESVDRIAVGVGPGTFTGLRIGVATARALAGARAIPIPLFAVSTLQSMAINVRGSGSAEEHQVVLPVLDARRGEAFAAAWRLAGEPQQAPSLGEQLLEPCALTPAALGEWIVGLGLPPLAIGPGAVEFRSALEPAGAVVPPDGSKLHRVTALNHCRLVARLSAAEATGDVRPQYLRLPDAELARRKREASSGTRFPARELPE